MERYDWNDGLDYILYIVEIQIHMLKYYDYSIHVNKRISLEAEKNPCLWRISGRNDPYKYLRVMFSCCFLLIRRSEEEPKGLYEDNTRLSSRPSELSFKYQCMSEVDSEASY